MAAPRMTARPGIRFAPRALHDLKSGIDQLADLVRPTLGPTPRCVAVAKTSTNQPPEILDNGATILRRTIQISDPYADMGAMLLRHTVWQVHSAVGDGTVTTAILMQSIVEQATRFIAAGGHPVSLRRGLESGLSAALAALQQQVRPLESASAITCMAEALCHDRELAALLGEILDVVGPDGYVEVQKGNGRGLERHYVEGVHWQQGYFSTYFVDNSHERMARLINPAILISDLRLTDAEELAPLLEQMAQGSQRSLLVIAQQVSGSALALMLANHQAQTLRLLAVKAPAHGVHQAGSLEDLAVLTGGRVVTQAAGQRAQHLSLADLGHARQAWANASSFGVLGGQGAPVKLRERIAMLRAELARAQGLDEQQKLRERLGKLLGGIAILQVGAATKTELEARRASAERALRTLRLAHNGGVVPGGGTVYLACQQAIQELPAPADQDELAGLKVLARALEEPLRVLAWNGGHEPSTIVAKVKSRPPGWGLDARTGEVVDVSAAGILDAAAVLKAALEAAVSGAIMALTTDVLVHHRHPQVVYEP